MMQNTASRDDTAALRRGEMPEGPAGGVAKTTRFFIALVRAAAAHRRSRRQLARWDARMLQDIGLEPFEVWFEWRGPHR